MRGPPPAIFTGPTRRCILLVILFFFFLPKVTRAHETRRGRLLSIFFVFFLQRFYVARAFKIASARVLNTISRRNTDGEHIFNSIENYHRFLAFNPSNLAGVVRFFHRFKRTFIDSFNSPKNASVWSVRIYLYSATVYYRCPKLKFVYRCLWMFDPRGKNDDKRSVYLMVRMVSRIWVCVRKRKY